MSDRWLVLLVPVLKTYNSLPGLSDFDPSIIFAHGWIATIRQDAWVEWVPFSWGWLEDSGRAPTPPKPWLCCFILSVQCEVSRRVSSEKLCTQTECHLSWQFVVYTHTHTHTQTHIRWKMSDLLFINVSRGWHLYHLWLFKFYFTNINTARYNDDHVAAHVISFTRTLVVTPIRGVRKHGSTEVSLGGGGENCNLYSLHWAAVQIRSNHRNENPSKSCGIHKQAKQTHCIATP